MTRKCDDLAEQEIILLYNEGFGTTELATIYNYSTVTIRNILKRNKITIRKISYNHNEDLFKNIDTEEKAYFLGLLYADGNVYTNNSCYEVTLKLHSKDIKIIERFRDMISPQYSIKQTKDHYSYLRINNKKIVEQLINLSCIPNKSLILKYPNFLPSELTHHFIRGYSDGDGSIYNYKKRNNHVDYKWQITSTQEFCRSVKEIIKNQGITGGSIRLVKPNNIITSTLSIGGNNQVTNLLNWLYKDATIYLDRKYQRYQDLINRHLQK